MPRILSESALGGRLSKALLVCCISALALQTQAVSVKEDIPLDKANNYRYGWTANACLGGVGAVYNITSLFMMLSLDESHRVQFYKLNICINISDLCLSLELMIYSIAFLNHGALYGGAVCQSEAVLALISIAITILCISGMSLVARYDICNHRKFTDRQMNMFIAGILVYTLILCIIVYFVPSPYGGNKPDFSGLFCFIDWSATVTTPVIYVFGLILPICYMSYNVYIIYITVKQAQDILRSHGIKEVAKGQYIQMALKLSYFAVTAMIFYTPSAVSTFYEITTRQYLSTSVSAFVQAMGDALPCIVTPTLFYYLNPDLREIFWKKIGKHLFGWVITSSRGNRIFDDLSMKASSFLVNSKSSMSLLSEVGVRGIKIYPNASSVGSQESVIDYEDVETWLSDATLRAVFEEHCRSEYVIENVLFVDYARTYVIAAREVDRMFENGDRKSIEIEKAWNALEEQAKKMFELFIQPQIAPFEINIDYKMRGRIKEILVPNPGVGVKFPPLNDASDEIITERIHLFENSLQCVLEIIGSDVWPRFRKSPRFRKAMNLQTTTGNVNPV